MTEMWAAIAAVFAAIAAWGSLTVQRRMERDSVRPFLILDGWQCELCADAGTIYVANLRNVGRGPALDVELCLLGDSRGARLGESRFVSVLPASESATIDARFPFVFDYGDLEYGSVLLRTRIEASDVRGDRHRTVYHLIVYYEDSRPYGVDELTRNLGLVSADTTVTWTWPRRFKSRVAYLVHRLRKPIRTWRLRRHLKRMKRQKQSRQMTQHGNARNGGPDSQHDDARG
jgi:hypothetical protein